MDLELGGKVALVTGGSKGIGKAVAQVLAEEGADVAICARSQAQLEATASELSKATGRRVLPVVADVSDSASVDAMVEQIVSSLGRIDILVNNAGVPGGLANGPIATVTDEAMHADLNTKFMGALRCSRAVAPHMKAQGWGRVVNIAGQNARTPVGYSGGARNVAMVHFSRTLAEELGPSGVTVNTVHPGLTRTEFVDALVAQRAERDGVAAAEAERRMTGHVAIRRIVEAREIGYAVAFLASAKAAAITGAVIDSSGASVRAVFL